MVEKTVYNKWLEIAERDFAIAKILFKAKYYETCLFHCQQSLEKLLKGIIADNTRVHPPYIHSC